MELQIVSALLDNDKFDEAKTHFPLLIPFKNTHHYQETDKLILADVELKAPVSNLHCIGFILDQRQLSGYKRCPILVNECGLIYSYDSLEQTLCFRAFSLFALVEGSMWKDDDAKKVYYYDAPGVETYGDNITVAVRNSPHERFILQSESETHIKFSSHAFPKPHRQHFHDNPIKRFKGTTCNFTEFVDLSELPVVFLDLINATILFIDPPAKPDRFKPARLIKDRVNNIHLIYKGVEGEDTYFYFNPTTSKLLNTGLSELCFKGDFYLKNFNRQHWKCRMTVGFADFKLIMRKMWSVAHMNLTDAQKTEEERRRLERHSSNLFNATEILVRLTNYRLTNFMRSKLKEIEQSVQSFFGAGMVTSLPNESIKSLFFPTTPPTHPHCKNLLIILGASIRDFATKKSLTQAIFLGITLILSSREQQSRIELKQNYKRFDVTPVLTYSFTGYIYHIDTKDGCIKCVGTNADFFNTEDYTHSSNWVYNFPTKLNEIEFKMLTGFMIKRCVEFFYPALTFYLDQ
ncbi:hypothetical protein [Ranid herpesvirus 3]|uniref:Uncharacterized protein n=1 Tax=Ranid herpesvirus 3 TaxID=1987509 RepID=A0A1X9T541_9VIRU|nr:hypothetical protein [Ranid herpesvirus 3]ARR28822.1 hypothetical protein [Ranid herpesvirus 3]